MGLRDRPKGSAALEKRKLKLRISLWQLRMQLAKEKCRINSVHLDEALAYAESVD